MGSLYGLYYRNYNCTYKVPLTLQLLRLKVVPRVFFLEPPTASHRVLNLKPSPTIHKNLRAFVKHSNRMVGHTMPQLLGGYQGIKDSSSSSPGTLNLLLELNPKLHSAVKSSNRPVVPGMTSLNSSPKGSM